MFTRFILVYAAMVVVDAVWLGVIAQPFFTKYLSHLMTRHSGTIPAALLTWLLLTIGLYVFVLPLATNGSRVTAFGYGALFGMCVYGVYELTNYAIITKWALPVVIVDTLWGGFLCGTMTLLFLL